MRQGVLKAHEGEILFRGRSHESDEIVPIQKLSIHLRLSEARAQRGALGSLLRLYEGGAETVSGLRDEVCWLYLMYD